MPTEFDYDRECQEIDEWLMEMQEEHSEQEEDRKDIIKPIMIYPGKNIFGYCDCCGKHNTQLKPFSKAENPFVGDSDGAILVCQWRCLVPGQLDIADCTQKTWECKDCFCLSDTEFWKIVREKWEAQKKALSESHNDINKMEVK